VKYRHLEKEYGLSAIVKLAPAKTETAGIIGAS
jgi:hypothetical protein